MISRPFYAYRRIFHQWKCVVFLIISNKQIILDGRMCQRHGPRGRVLLVIDRMNNRVFKLNAKLGVNHRSNESLVRGNSTGSMTSTAGHHCGLIMSTSSFREREREASLTTDAPLSTNNGSGSLKAGLKDKLSIRRTDRPYTLCRRRSVTSVY